MQGRLYTFGCSFTSYVWTTWADILLSAIPGENWGRSGTGNKFILESLVECNLNNNITSNDTVIIMWTSWSREDRYLDNGWLCEGNIFREESIFDDSFIEKYWSQKGSILHNLNYMVAAIQILKLLKCKFIMCWGFPPYQIQEYSNEFINSLEDSWKFKKYLDFLNQHKEYFVSQPLLNNPDRTSFWKQGFYYKNTTDIHPTPVEQWEWLKKNLIDRLNLDNATIDQCFNAVKCYDELFTEVQEKGIHPSVLGINNPFYKIINPNLAKNRI